jgi:hypothetical protein
MISLLLWILIAILVVIALKYLLAELNLPPNIQHIFLLIVAVVFLILILNRVGVIAW